MYFSTSLIIGSLINFGWTIADLAMYSFICDLKFIVQLPRTFNKHRYNVLVPLKYFLLPTNTGSGIKSFFGLKTFKQLFDSLVSCSLGFWFFQEPITIKSSGSSFEFLDKARTAGETDLDAIFTLRYIGICSNSSTDVTLPSCASISKWNYSF